MSNLPTDQGESFEQANQPTLCANNCGFFANPACMNLCSKCYRDIAAAEQKDKQQTAAVVQALKSTTPVAPRSLSVASEVVPDLCAQAQVVDPLSAASAAAPTPSNSGSEEDRPPQKNTSRCFECNKRVGLTGFKCRCGYVYCANHRYAEKHNCKFDYKTMDRQKLEASNPLVMASKITKF